MIDALKNKYSLPNLLSALHTAPGLDVGSTDYCFHGTLQQTAKCKEMRGKNDRLPRISYWLKRRPS